MGGHEGALLVRGDPRRHLRARHPQGADHAAGAARARARRRDLRLHRAGLQCRGQGLRLLHLLLHPGRHAHDLPVGRLFPDRPDAALAAGRGVRAAAESGGRPRPATRSGQSSRRAARAAAHPARIRRQRLLSGWSSRGAASSGSSAPHFPASAPTHVDAGTTSRLASHRRHRPDRRDVRPCTGS